MPRHAHYSISLNGWFWPVAACDDQDSINARPAALRRKRSFKDGLTEQMNSFDECRLSPISGRSDNRVATGRKRPVAAHCSSKTSTSGFRGLPDESEGGV